MNEKRCLKSYNILKEKRGYFQLFHSYNKVNGLETDSIFMAFNYYLLSYKETDDNDFGIFHFLKQPSQYLQLYFSPKF